MSSVPPRPPAPVRPKVPEEAPSRILQGGRAKAYRPLPAAERARAIRRGLAAYRRGDYFLAHELLEPAWLGTPDPAERDLLSGLIKLAAAYVHAARGNPLGALKNLRGAQERLARGAQERLARSTQAADETLPVDVEALLAAIGNRVRRLEAAVAEGRSAPRSALRAPRLRRPLGDGTTDPAAGRSGAA